MDLPHTNTQRTRDGGLSQKNISKFSSCRQQAQHVAAATRTRRQSFGLLVSRERSTEVGATLSERSPGSHGHTLPPVTLSQLPSFPPVLQNVSIQMQRTQPTLQYKEKTRAFQLSPSGTHKANNAHTQLHLKYNDVPGAQRTRDTSPWRSTEGEGLTKARLTFSSTYCI